MISEKKCKECLLKNINSYVKKSTKYQPEFNPNPKMNDIKKLPKNNIHIPSLELVNIITSFSLLSKLSIHSYHSTLISPKIGTTNEDMVIQLTSLSSALLNDKKQIKKELIYKRPLVKQNSIDNYKSNNYNNISDNNGNLKTLDNISINTNILNRTIDSSLYKYQLSAQKNYDEKSLAEFLNDEIKNIKQSQSINNNNSTIITHKKRPSTPNNTSSNLHKQMTKEPSILLDFNKEDYINFNSNNNNKINILKNKNFNGKKQSHVHLNTYNNNNSKSNSYFNSKTNTITNNNRTTYCSFRTGNIKQQSNKNIIKARKQDPLIPLKKQKEIANVQIYDHSKYDSKLNNKINIKTQNHSSSNSFYISSFTPRKEYTKSFISERTRSVKTMKKIGSVNKSTENINKNVISKRVNNKKEGTDKAKNVNCNGNKVNITIDIRDLMKDDYEERLLKKSFQQFDQVSLVNNEIDIENSNEVGNEILVANGRDSLDNLIITQKENVNCITNTDEINNNI